uniref:Putative peptidase n=1 Tax=viral metagenome TaxID=1070528 RepID=A0A6M3LB88_9ZZZZ
MYKHIRDKINSGDIIEWRSASPLGSIIRFFTRQKVNHSSLCICLPQYKDWKEPHKFILEANPGGIELQLLSRRLQEFKGSAWWLKLKVGTEKTKEAIESWALPQVGVKYDYGSLFKNAIGRVSADSRKFFCSEFCYLALQHAGIILKTKKNRAPRPGEFGQFSIFDKPIQIS